MRARNSQSTSNISKNKLTNSKTDKLNSRINKSEIDKINIQIISELLKNADIKSSEISKKLKVPLSTIQRRRTRIERQSMLNKKYEIDYKQLGFRKADIFVTVSKGDCVEIAKRIVNEHRENVLEVSIRIGNPKVNLMVLVIYKDSDEIFDMIQNIRKMDHVEYVEWSEIVKMVLKNDSGIISKI